MVLMVALDEDDWLLVRIVYFFLSSIAIIALVSNSLLLYTSIVTKNLRSTCNILIGCCALFDMCLNIGELVQFPQVLFQFYIDSYVCSAIQVHLTGIAIYCSYTPYLMYKYFIHQPVICTVTSVFHGDAAQLWSYAVNSANLLSLIVYILGWLAIRRSQTGESERE
ncbi:hypothetical protein PRIPAC_97381 [Pristionchus pacificus]|uniref:G protein-coupled receptor n=1 Tax=Pristionchus pacificus TaxID=54126 RepID=A0A2A6D1D8_PRIPA|nr:hypothetical protein PRIPAC_97381 [Pristionchus pacificus]|eukprot:PDM84188.1 G protein-coupled receptor [Pristionchus pacificus]